MSSSRVEKVAAEHCVGERRRFEQSGISEAVENQSVPDHAVSMTPRARDTHAESGTPPLSSFIRLLQTRHDGSTPQGILIEQPLVGLLESLALLDVGDDSSRFFTTALDRTPFLIP